MSADDLFSGGFAWNDEQVSQDDATPFATPETVPERGAAVFHMEPVASVASVATEIAPAPVGPVSQGNVASPATVIATPESANFCGFAGQSGAGVAPVASVANWRESVASLSHGPGPLEIEPRRWTALVSDARKLVTHWGDQLFAAGWSTLDVFGVPRQPGARRLDCVGLVAVIGGRAILDVSPDIAVIKASPRDTTRFHRSLIARGGVPIWQWLEGERF